MHTKDFLRYTEDIYPIHSKNVCAQCGNEILEKDLIWLDRVASVQLCTHALCGAILQPIGENSYIAIGWPYSP